MARAPRLQGNVASTGCTSASKAEEEKAPDEKRALRDLRHINQIEEPEVSAVRLGHGCSQTAYPTMGLRCMQLHRLRDKIALPFPSRSHGFSGLRLARRLAAFDEILEHPSLAYENSWTH